MRITAAIVNETSGPFVLEQVDLDRPRPDEVLVRIAAAGLCHTDLLMRDGVYEFPLPGVLGHEGAGVVEEIGADVRQLKRGDHVVLPAIAFCGGCSQCLQGSVAYCEHIFVRSFAGARPDGSSALSRDGQTIHGHFCGQSSFATHAVVKEMHAVRIRTDVPIELMAPTACAAMTGVGAVVNSLGATAGSTIAVFGTGSVGLSAVMGARLAGCSAIVAIDPIASRRELALELGATHALDPDHDDEPVPKRILDLTCGKGVHHSLDTTGQPAVIRQALESLAVRGSCGVLGGSPLGTEVGIDPNVLLFSGRSIRGIVQGDALPSQFIPRLVELYVAGRLPLERLVSFYPLAELERAVADTVAGRAVKAILRP